MRRRTILVVEDDAEVRNYLKLAFGCQGFSVEAVEDGEEALSRLNSHNGLALVLLDIVLPTKGGMEVLRQIRRTHPDLPVIVLSGVASPGNIVEAMKYGAADFLVKPVGHEELTEAIRKVLGSRPLASELCGELRTGLPSTTCHLLASKTNPEEFFDRVATSDVPVVLQGETGVGKEVLARELHARSPRARKPFLKVNCAAVPSELIESELFGYERGAFTGAFRNKPGKFELADGGTILLDEIGDMDVKLQAKLLHVLQDQEFERLGGKEPVRVNVRVMAATHCDLEKAVREGRFRADLYYRLNVISITIPPLRERKDEILTLAGFLLRKHAPAGVEPPAIPPVLRQALLVYDWPGNVRELENIMRRYLVLQDAEVIARELSLRAANRSVTALAPEALDSAIPGKNGSLLDKVEHAKRAAEKDAIRAALDATGWNRKQAARLLGVDYKALLYKMKKLGIGQPRFGWDAASSAEEALPSGIS
ncbi:MAG TPA: sigma-54 dependent transcriptional regulator [Chthonomonadales bacterium]|nr:sigma-54 dependent transcriptional regulator [Chthonomonadales bacterium]